MKIQGLARVITIAGGSCGMLLGTAPGSAAIVVQHQYDLGEAGSMSGAGAPLDSVGGSHFTNVISPAFTINTSSPSPVSSAYASDTGAVPGVYGAEYSGFATDNFGIELWVRTADVNQATNDIFVTNAHTNGSAKFTITGGNWAASYHGFTWVGAGSGTGQTATANEWTHLAIIRDNGVSTFYINGVAQSGTPGNAPVHGAGGHLGVTPGGGSGLSVTSTPSASSPSSRATTPSPSSTSPSPARWRS